MREQLQAIAPCRHGAGERQHRPFPDPLLRGRRPRDAVALQDRLEERRARREDPGPLGPDATPRRDLVGGSRAKYRECLDEPVQRDEPVLQRTGHDLDEVRGGSAHRHDRGRRGRGTGGDGRGGRGSQLPDLGFGRGIVSDVRRGQARAADADPRGIGATPRPDENELRAASTDVHDQEVGLDRATRRGAEEREEALLAVIDHVERDAGRRLDGNDNGPGVRGPAKGLRAHERDPFGAEAAGGGCVSGKRGEERTAGVGGDEPSCIDERAESEQGRLVGQGHHQMPVDPADEEVRRVRSDVDRSTDRAAECRRAVSPRGAGPPLVRRCRVPPRVRSPCGRGASERPRVSPARRPSRRSVSSAWPPVSQAPLA